jgi:hypothetical protein
MMFNRRTILAAAAASAGLGAVPARAAGPVDVVTLKHRDGRETLYRMMAPATGGRWPVVLFSHGANSSALDYDLLWQAWAARGYCVIGPNHIDSAPPGTRPDLGTGALWRARVADTALPLQQQAPFDAQARQHGGRPQWHAVCAAGHSFGAVVAQALAGATLFDPGDHTPYRADAPRPAACMVFSPPGPLKGYIPANAWTSVTVPALLQTGDIDVLPGFVDDWHLRLTGFAAAPGRWTIVGRGVDHYFGGLICRRKQGATAALPALNQTAALSAEFLDAYLRGSTASLNRLEARAAAGDDGVVTFAKA